MVLECTIQYISEDTTENYGRLHPIQNDESKEKKHIHDTKINKTEGIESQTLETLQNINYHDRERYIRVIPYRTKFSQTKF